MNLSSSTSDSLKEELHIHLAIAVTDKNSTDCKTNLYNTTFLETESG